MKKLSIIFMLLIAVAFSSCSNSTGGGVIGPGGGGTGNITFTTSVVQDQQGSNYFQYVPSEGVTLTTITASCPQLQITNEVVNGDGTTVFTPTNPLQVGPVQNLATGQQWTFVIVGKVGSSTGTAYSTTVNYTVQ